MFSANLGQVSSLPVAPGTLLAEFIVLTGLGDFDDFGSDAQSFVAGNVVRSLARAHVEDFATVLFGAGSGVPVAAAVEQQLAGFVAGLTDADPARVIRRITICEIDARKYAALRRAATKVARQLSSSELRIVVDEGDTSSAGAGMPKPRGAATHRRDPVYLVVTLVQRGRSEYECRSSLLTAGAKAAVLSGTVRVSRIVGLGNVVELVAGGECISAVEARELGWITDIVPAESLVPAPLRLIRAEQSRGD